MEYYSLFLAGFFMKIRCSVSTTWLSMAVPGSIILAALLALGGCGSDSKPGPPQTPAKAKPVIDQGTGKAKVVEITPGKSQVTETKIKEDARSTKSPAALLLDEEVVPPSAPGEKGLTRRDLENLKAAQPKIDPMDEEVIPPAAPGGKRITRRELENMQKQQPAVDPMDEEVVPPSGPGEKGMTLRELERLKAMSPEIPQEAPGPLPPTHPRPQPGKK
jgi:hypothetical protein